jgi:hypothetical protein
MRAAGQRGKDVEIEQWGASQPCSSPHVIRLNRGRRSGWTEQETFGREDKMYIDFQLANLNNGFHWDDLEIDSGIILK